jgi:cell division protein FtsB
VQLAAEKAAAALAHGAAPRTLPPQLAAEILQTIHAEKASRPAIAFREWIPWAIAAAITLFCGFLLSERTSSGQKFAEANEQVRALNGERDRAVQLAAERERQASAAQAELAKLRAEREDLIRQIASLEEKQKTMRVENTTLAERRDDLEKKIAQLEKSDSPSQIRVATLTSKFAAASKPAATIVWDTAKQQGILNAANLPATGRNEDYQVWIIDPQYKQPVSAGVFSSGSDGAIEFTFHPNQRITVAKAFAVSLERKGGVAKAEGPMVLVSK